MQTGEERVALAIINENTGPLEKRVGIIVGRAVEAQIMAMRKMITDEHIHGRGWNVLR